MAMPVIALAFACSCSGRCSRGRPTPTARSDRSPATITWIWTSEVLRRLGYAMYAVAALLIAASSVSGGTLSFAIEGGYHAYHGAKRARRDLAARGRLALSVAGL